MNITYYKRHKKMMKNMLDRENAKHGDEKSQFRINSLERSIRDCGMRIRKLQEARKILKSKGKGK